MPRRKFWGVDSAAEVTNDLYHCVTGHYGVPRYWGRYLRTVQGAAAGLSGREIQLLHGKEIKIAPIYGGLQSATGYRNGKVTAHNAVYHARKHGIPKDTFIFANIEKNIAVDEAWIRGWVDAMFPIGYRPGLYCTPNRERFDKAYCAAVSKDGKVAEQTVIWSQEPTPGVTKKTKAPKYNPAKPSCKANVWLWKYGENAPNCPVDTDLMDSRLLNNLF